MFKKIKPYRLLFILTLLVIGPGVASAQAPCPSCQVSTDTQDLIPADRIKFWIYTPPGNNPSEPAPLLINLHGQGQIGNDINLLVNQPQDATPAYLIANSQWPASRPFIVVSPQLKRDDDIPNIWDQDWPADYIDKVIEYVKTIRTINPDKIYIMGLSLGGQGCMLYGAAYPNKVAAMVPMAGRTDDVILDGKACSLVNIPIWIFHGTEDLLLNYSNATNMAAAINACPNPGSIKPHVTLLDATVHNGMWNPIYSLSAGYPVYDWMLKFTKNSTSNAPPVVSIGADKRFLVSDGTIYLPSEYFDSDGSITSVLWTQTQGTPSLTLDQTNPRILKISNLAEGSFQFRLTVTDNLGATGHDDITITLLGSSTANRITGFTLVNAGTGTNIDPLVNERVINKNTLGVTDINVRAILNNPGDDVVFRVNSHQFTRIVGGWNADGITVFEIFPPNGWKIFTGDHVVCATPNTANGISKCVKFSVVTQTLQNYYPQPGENLSLLASWGTNTNGSGSPPGSFNGNFQVFNVNTAAPQNGALTISGTESALWVRSGGEMTVSNTFTGVINVEGNGIVNVHTNQPVVFGSISPSSTVRFGAAVTSIPARTYGHVVIEGASTTKTLGSGATIITGNLTIANDVAVNGAADNTSNIQLTGNLTLHEDNEFNPATRFSLTLSAGQPHALNFSGTKAVFNQLSILGNSVVSVTQGTLPKTLELGSTTGGGLIVHAGSELGLGKNHLNIIGSGTINPQNLTGRIAFDNSNLSITSSSSSNSYLYTNPLPANNVSAVTANLTGAGALIIQDSLFVTASVKMLNGTLNANGFLTLVSTDDQTASIDRVEGTGDITGDVRFQRYVRSGRMYRYLSFPVEGVTVADLQKRVPVTGTFTGASTGGSLTTNPSLFQYQEPGGWLPYPTTSSAAELSMGKGYAVFIRKADDPTTITVAGQVHTGNFVFQLPNAGSTAALEGWSLLGNPYAAPIQWGGAGWISTGINPTAYVRDNEVGNGRFLQWNGVVGDPEFAGLIAQGQAFWVKAYDPDITPSLTVQETAKSTEQATMFRTKSEDISALTISLNHNRLTDRTFLIINNLSDNSFNPRLDGVKQQNSYYNLATLTSDSVLVAIKNMPDTCSALVTLSVQHTKPGTYSFEFSGSVFDTEREIFLNDNYLEENVRVSPGEHYTFQITEDPKTFGHKRFQLLATVEIPEPEISVEDAKLVSSVTADIQWLLNGEEIPGATQPNYTPLSSGDYQVRVTKSSCSKTSPPFAYVITGTEPRQPAIQLYPNPAEHSVSVKGISKPTPYTLLNSWGQAIQAGLLSAENTEIELTFSSGLYILALEGETGVQRHKLIIKK